MALPVSTRSSRLRFQPMGRKSAEQPSGWMEYFRAACAASTPSIDPSARGWVSELARRLEMSDVTVGRWARGERVPEIDFCRALAKVWGRPTLEVLVAAGYLEPEEANLPAHPPAPRWLPPQLERLALFLNDPDAPDALKAHIKAQIELSAGLVDDVTTSTERRIS